MSHYTPKKRCPICQEEKELTGEHWHINSKGKPSSYCKPCVRKRRQDERHQYRNQEKQIPDFKICSSCGENKHNLEWPRNSNTKDGLHYYCKVCISQQWAGRTDRKIREENKKRERFQKTARYSQYVYGYVYLIKTNEYTKIGISIDPARRLDSIDGSSPYEVSLIHLIETDNMQRLETELHSQFAAKHHRKEWFLLSDEDIQQIIGMGDKVIYGA